jgi:hypothetical protein
MQLLSWLRKRMTARPQTRRTPAGRPAPRFRPWLEALEGRDVPSFSAPVSSGGVFLPLALAAADVNSDGKPDLVTMPGNASGNVLLNKGNGTFGGTPLPVSGDLNPTTAMAVGDVNGDGKLDIVLANSPSTDPTDPPYPGSVSVLLGDGQGGFRSAVTASGAPAAEYILPGAGTISSLALADVNGDGKPDLIAVDAGGTVFVAPNEGNGIFGTAQGYQIPANLAPSVPCEVAVGDVNGDGKPDIVVTDPWLNSVSVLLNAGNGTFGAAQTYAVGADPAALALGDVSGDGKLDIVTANTNGTVSVLVNQGTGAFGAAQSYAVGGPVNSVALADFTHDGRLDIATAGSTETDMLLNNGSGAFGAYQKVGPAGSQVVAADFNGDGFPGLALIDGSGASTDVVLNNADWMPGPVAVRFGSITYTSTKHLYSETVTLTNHSSGTLTGPMSLELTNLPSSVVLTDATGTVNGNAYIRFLKSGKTLKPGASLSVTLTFTAPSLGDIDFGTEVLAL